MAFKSTKAIQSLCLMMLLTACASPHYLAPTPNLYTRDAGYPADDIPNELKTATPELLYVTDRNMKVSPEGDISYGSERSPSMALGSVKIPFGKDLTWEDIKAHSESEKREKKIRLKVEDTKELVRFPKTPMPFYLKDDKILLTPKVQKNYDKAKETFREELKLRIEKSQKKEVLFFVHGFNNDFSNAGLSLADIWHFSGRSTVPIFYSWPAANGGLLGYFADKESGEFTIYHLKETLRMIAAMDSIEKVHIIAHSRGTDITTTALRELVIEARGSGKRARDVLKIENLILAAPDLDFGVARQRLMAEKFAPAIGKITVYMNQGDEALGLSQYLLSGTRFGKISKNDLVDDDKEIFMHIKNVNFIDVEGVNSFFGHAYYRQHRGVLSDIALIVGDNANAGTKERPLLNNKFNFWTLPENYPNN